MYVFRTTSNLECFGRFQKALILGNIFKQYHYCLTRGIEEEYFYALFKVCKILQICFVVFLKIYFAFTLACVILSLILLAKYHSRISYFLNHALKDGPGSNQNVSLVYTNSDEHSHSEEVAKFTVPKLTKKWSKIVIKVSVTDVTLYLNCHEMARQRVTRIPQELVFDTASTLYIAQAGPHIQERYDVSTVYTFRIPFPRKKNGHCEHLCVVQRNKTKRAMFVANIFHRNRHSSAHVAYVQ